MDSRFRAKESDRPDALCRDRFARIFADTSPLPRGRGPLVGGCQDSTNDDRITEAELPRVATARLE
jgi:O-methyltransferase involved in polyketide biosynthesis